MLALQSEREVDFIQNRQWTCLNVRNDFSERSNDYSSHQFVSFETHFMKLFDLSKLSDSVKNAIIDGRNN